MVLNAHAGTKYGISFPVLCRASFGVRGAEHAGDAPRDRRMRLVRNPDLDRRRWRWTHCSRRRGRAGPACRAAPPSPSWCSGCIQVAIILKGTEGIKMLESWSAPLLLAGGATAAALGHHGAAAGSGTSAGRVGAPSGRRSTPFWALFPSALTANVGYWATLSLNIPDFTRYAQEPALPDAGPGAGAPDHDDGVRVHRRGGHQRDDRALRRGDLGSRSC